MTSVTLVPLSNTQRDAFTKEQIADYAEYMIDVHGCPREGAAERARDELLPELEREFAVAERDGHRLWTAFNKRGTAVGWLWVRPPYPDMPEDSVFLEQITVKAAHKRQGYGRAMLRALERQLADAGVDAIYLHVNETNLPAQRLYETSGYQVVERRRGKRRMVKQLRQ